MFLDYYIVAAIAALVVGSILGFVFTRASARRQVERINNKVRQLEEALADATNHEKIERTPSSAPARWTGTEIAAVIGAIGSLCGILGTIYNSYQGAELTRLKTETGRLETAKRESEDKFASLTSSVRSTFWLEPQQWDRIEPIAVPDGPIKELQLDDKRLSNVCRGRWSTLVYRGTGPAIVECDKGMALIDLKGNSKILIMPSGIQKPSS